MPTCGKGGRSIRGHTRNESKLLFGTGSWLQCKPANLSIMRVHSARYLIADEAAEYTAGALANAIARTSLFPNKKIVVTSTPLYDDEGEPGNEFMALYKAGTQEEWNMRCLACGGLIPTKFRDCIKWDNEKSQKSELEYDMEIVRKTTRLECPHCKNRHDNTKDNVMEMNRLGEYVAANPKADRRIRSFHFNKISLPPPINY